MKSEKIDRNNEARMKSFESINDFETWKTNYYQLKSSSGFSGKKKKKKKKKKKIWVDGITVRIKFRLAES
jgi:hypothetical protein